MGWSHQGSTPSRFPRASTRVEEVVASVAATGKLYGRHYDDLLACKYLHQRYRSYLRWLESRPR